MSENELESNSSETGGGFSMRLIEILVGKRETG